MVLVRLAAVPAAKVTDGSRHEALLPFVGSRSMPLIGDLGLFFGSRAVWWGLARWVVGWLSRTVKDVDQV